MLSKRTTSLVHELHHVLCYRDGEAEKLYKALEDSNKELQDQKIKVEALKIMKTGDYKADQLQRRKSVTSLIQPGVLIVYSKT